MVALVADRSDRALRNAAPAGRGSMRVNVRPGHALARPRTACEVPSARRRAPCCTNGCTTCCSGNAPR